MTTYYALTATVEFIVIVLSVAVMTEVYNRTLRARQTQKDSCCSACDLVQFYALLFHR
jgi:hypothetical protein